jgi:acyl carrier protein
VESPAALPSAVEDKFGVQFTEEEIPRLDSLVSFAEHLENSYAA